MTIAALLLFVLMLAAAVWIGGVLIDALGIVGVLIAVILLAWMLGLL